MCAGDWAPPGASKCVVRAERELGFKDDGVWWSTGTGYYTGSQATSCDGNGGTGDTPMPSTPKPEDGSTPEPGPGEAAPSPCPAGQAPGEVNGVGICAPMGGDRPTVSDAPGTGSSTTRNPDGSSSSTNQTGSTTCQGGQCTTSTSSTTTITNAPGNTSCPAGATSGTATVDGQSRTTCTTTSSGSSSSSQGDFCRVNPSNKQCGDGQGSSFGGNCEAGFVAKSDDAVLNAMAKEQHKRNCQFFEKVPDPTDETRAFDDMKAKGQAGEDQTDDLPESSRPTMSISPGDIDSSNLLGTSQCIQDLTIVVMDKSIKLPFSQICPYLEYLGTILMICAYLVAARVVIRG